METKYKQLINLYNSGITDKNRLEELLNLSSGSVNIYINKAYKQGLIKKVKPKTTFDTLVELYNSGLTDHVLLSKELGVSQQTIYCYIGKAKKQGLISQANQPSKYEKLINLYNSGTTDANIIADKLDLSLKTVYDYINRAFHRGQIQKVYNKPISKYMELVELYNSGTTDVNLLADKLDLSIKTVYAYISRALSEELIKRVTYKPRAKSEYKHFIALYNSGITDKMLLAGKLGLSEKTVSRYISKASRKNSIKKISDQPKGKYKDLIELYNSGETSPQLLADRLGISSSTVYRYISIASENGLIEKDSDRPKGKYNELIKLYNSGTTDVKLLASKLNLSTDAIYAYISKASRNGLIEKKTPNKPKNKYDELIELYNSGITDPKVLADKLGILIKTVYDYTSKASKQGLIMKKHSNKSKRNNITGISESALDNSITPDINMQSSEPKQEIDKSPNSNVPDVPDVSTPQPVDSSATVRTAPSGNGMTINKPQYQHSQKTGILSSSDSDLDIYVANTRLVHDTPASSNKEVVHKSIKLEAPNLTPKQKIEINTALQTMYPTQASKYLNIPVKTIYDYIDTLPSNKRISLKTSILKTNLVWNALKKEQEKMNKDGKKISTSEALMNVVPNLKEIHQIDLIHLYFWMSNSKTQAYAMANKIARNPFYSEGLRIKANSELKVLKDEVLITQILAEVRTKLEKYGTMPSYSYLCDKYNVRISFLVQLLGREELSR